MYGCGACAAGGDADSAVWADGAEDEVCAGVSVDCCSGSEAACAGFDVAGLVGSECVLGGAAEYAVWGVACVVYPVCGSSCEYWADVGDSPEGECAVGCV